MSKLIIKHLEATQTSDGGLEYEVHEIPLTEQPAFVVVVKSNDLTQSTMNNMKMHLSEKFGTQKVLVLGMDLDDQFEIHQVEGEVK